MTEVSARLATPTSSEADATLLTNLFQLYLHDLTAFTDFYDVGEDGLFYPDYLRGWVRHESPSQLPYVLREGERPAGFALIGRAPYPLMGKGRDYRVCEFFVLNRSRRGGVGRRAAHAIFDELHGVWEVSELPNNARAIAFWRTVVGEFTGGRYEETIEHGDVVQVFTSRPRR